MIYTIDAKEKSLGRIASEAASVLMGKKSPDFAKNKVKQVKVEIINASKVKMSPKKMEVKRYASYSGYPGGLTKENASAIIDKKGHSELFRLAVYGMIPNNKLKKGRIKNLTVKE